MVSNFTRFVDLLHNSIIPEQLPINYTSKIIDKLLSLEKYKLKKYTKD